MKLPDPEPPVELPTLDQSRRFPEDQLLRSHGFRIHERRAGQEPAWELKGHLYCHATALRMVRRGERLRGGL